MDIGDFLLDIATSFDRAAPMSSLPQTKLRRAGDYLEEHIPGGLLIIGSGGRGGPTFTPWVGVFDPDETSSPQHGIYVVYLFATDLQSVTLSLNQGMEEVRRELGDKGARARLALDAENVRDALPPESLTNLSKEMDLGPDSGARQKAYEAANIACLRYEVDSMPDEVDLRADLSRFLVLYEDAIAQKQWLLQHSPGSIGSSSVVQVVEPQKTDPLARFKPKDENDYTAYLTGQKLVKTRRHERLVREYGEWAADQGFLPSTEHPKDLVLTRNGEEWLVEAKVIRQGNATEAVRAALGQLFAYRHFYYVLLQKAPPDGVVALFSESVGDAYVDFLESIGVSSVWKEGSGWKGSGSAYAGGVAET